MFLKGLIVGFAIAAPVGPIGVLCIRRTLAEGRTTGFVSGLGAATADAMYGATAAFGLTLITDFLLGGASWLRLVGGVFLLYLGIKTFLARPAEKAAVTRGGGLLRAYSSTLFLTLTNPTTILSFVAVFAGLGLGEGAGGFTAAVLVLGVFLGSAAWWLLLSGTVGLFRRKLSTGCLRWVNRVSGVVITAFGVLAISGIGG